MCENFLFSLFKERKFKRPFILWFLISWKCLLGGYHFPLFLANLASNRRKRQFASLWEKVFLSLTQFVGISLFFSLISRMTPLTFSVQFFGKNEGTYKGGGRETKADCFRKLTPIKSSPLSCERRNHHWHHALILISWLDCLDNSNKQFANSYWMSKQVLDRFYFHYFKAQNS